MKYYTIIDKSVPRTFSHTGGYVRIRINGKLFYEHRYVMEKLNGKLKRNQSVHHINGNKRDNRPENLQLHTNSTHTIHHLEEYRKKVISKRRCDTCHSPTTYYTKGQPVWYRNPFNKSEWLCRSCYLKITKYEAGGKTRYTLILGHGTRSHK